MFLSRSICAFHNFPISNRKKLLNNSAIMIFFLNYFSLSGSVATKPANVRICAEMFYVFFCLSVYNIWQTLNRALNILLYL